MSPPLESPESANRLTELNSKPEDKNDPDTATDQRAASNVNAAPSTPSGAQVNIAELIQAFQAAQAQTPYRPLPPNLIAPLTAPQLGALSIQQTQIVHGNALAPALLDTLEKHAPGSVAKMVAMAEKQQNAIIQANENAQKYTRSDIKRAHYIAASLSVTCIIAALFSEKMGYPWVAGTFLAFPIPAIINSLNSLRIKSSAS